MKSVSNNLCGREETQKTLMGRVRGTDEVNLLEDTLRPTIKLP